MRNILRKCLLLLPLLILGVACASSARAQDGNARAAFGPPVAFDRLQDLRGGFELPSGLQASFGFERVVYVNGELVATTRVSIPDIGAITPAQAQSLAGAKGTTLLQVGQGNRFDGTSTMGGLVIQNTLDDQDIRVLTTLDAGTNLLGHFQALNAEAALHDALIVAPGSP
jgi:hypothetical protein